MIYVTGELSFPLDSHFQVCHFFRELGDLLLHTQNLGLIVFVLSMLTFYKSMNGYHHLLEHALQLVHLTRGSLLSCGPIILIRKIEIIIEHILTLGIIILYYCPLVPDMWALLTPVSTCIIFTNEFR